MRGEERSKEPYRGVREEGELRKVALSILVACVSLPDSREMQLGYPEINF